MVARAYDQKRHRELLPRLFVEKAKQHYYLMGQFVDCLEKDLAASMEPSIPASGEVTRMPARAAEPVDLVATAGVPVAKRAAPLVALVFLAYWLLRRRSKKKS